MARKVVKGKVEAATQQGSATSVYPLALALTGAFSLARSHVRHS